MKTKNLVLALSSTLFCSTLNSTAATIFSESMGTVTSTTSISSHETASGFDNDGFTYSGTGDIRTSTASSGYTGSSGSGNVFLTTTGNPTFTISGISTMGYTAGSIELSFGAYKGANASDMTDLIFEYSTNGTSWTAIAIPAQATGSGTSSWRLISFTPTSIPISDSLSLRWTNSGTATQYRLDDITLSSVPEPSTALLGAIGLLGILRRRR